MASALTNKPTVHPLIDMDLCKNRFVFLTVDTGSRNDLDEDEGR